MGDRAIGAGACSGFRIRRAGEAGKGEEGAEEKLSRSRSDTARVSARNAGEGGRIALARLAPYAPLKNSRAHDRIKLISGTTHFTGRSVMKRFMFLLVSALCLAVTTTMVLPSAGWTQSGCVVMADSYRDDAFCTSNSWAALFYDNSSNQFQVRWDFSFSGCTAAGWPSCSWHLTLPLPQQGKVVDLRCSPSQKTPQDRYHAEILLFFEDGKVFGMQGWNFPFQQCGPPPGDWELLHDFGLACSPISTDKATWGKVKENYKK